MKNTVDIIIPVYNSFKYVKACIESVLNNTKENFRIIIVNDNSSETELKEYFSTLKSHPNIIIINNTENLGFVKSVNIGMKFDQKNDVVLLNSDTEVTPNWLEKMHSCAYSNELIATVTPLSNNATIASVPNWCEDNEIPEGFSIKKFSELIESKSMKLYIEIPTAIGFCMYIKRSAINAVGLFDEINFGKGYGEENEFCMRVRSIGLQNVLDDATFVYHKGSATFSDEKRKQLVDKNLKTLDKIFPDYLPSVDNFLKSNKIFPIIDSINLWLKIKNNKENILYISHYEHAIGGTGIHIKHLIDSLDNYNVFWLRAEENGNLLLELFIDGKLIESWDFRVFYNIFFSSFDLLDRDRKIEKIVEYIINYFEIKLVHIHHLLGLPISLLSISKKNNIKSIITFHDYYILSGLPNLQKGVDENGDYIHSNSLSEYYKVLIEQASSSHKDKMLLIRMNHALEQIKNIDYLVAPSNHVTNEMKKISDSKINCIEHGVKMIQTKTTKQTSQKLNVAFLGVGAIHKGILDFLTLANDKDLEGNFNFLILGYLDRSMTGIENIKNMIRNIKITGQYTHDNLSEKLIENNIDLIIIPSIWPETYCYTLTEAIVNQIPVIGKDIGAIGDRIDEMNCGWKYNDTNDLKQILIKINENRDLLETKSKSGRKIKTLDTMISEYKNVYRDLINSVNKIEKKSPEASLFFALNSNTQFKYHPTTKRPTPLEIVDKIYYKIRYHKITGNMIELIKKFKS